MFMFTLIKLLLGEMPVCCFQVREGWMLQGKTGPLVALNCEGKI